ncbi:MAG: cobalamin biosynthesis protein [Marinibacterium sp.]|nr:cobalamin biosynthesis protein [Marinibacterium sp.]
MIVAGFGFRSGASRDSLLSALARCAPSPDDSAPRPQVLASARDKTETAAFRALARHLALPVIGVDADRLVAIDTPTRSAASQTARGTGSVAEAAALAAAGPNARLIARRVISDDGRATCALAQGDDT